MSSTDDNSLIGWYRERIGEPATEDEAVGYWIFAVGLVLGALGILLSTFAAPASGLRELAIVFGAAGLVLLLAGPIIRLPLRRNATLLTYLGVAIAALAVLWFIIAFPQNWGVRTGNAAIIALYGLGVAIIAIAGVLIPLLTTPSGEAAVVSRESADRAVAARETELRDEAAREGAERDEAAREQRDAAEAEQAALSEELRAARAALADSEASAATLAAELNALRESQARYELYQDRGDEWRWRLRHRNGNVVASSGEGYTRRHNAQKGLQSVRRNALGATVFQIENVADLPEEGEEFDPVGATSQATFEVYEDEGDEYRWRLRHDNGNILADSGEGYTSRRDARRALASVKQNAEPADYLWFDPAGFETYRDRGGEYRWRLVHRNGNVLADSGEGYATHGNARRAVRRLRERIDDLEVETYEDKRGEFRWRVRAENGEIVADGSQGYDSRDGVEEAVERLSTLVPAADTLEVGMAAFEIYEDKGGEFRWRLRHRNGNILADSSEGYSDRSGARDSIEGVKRNARGAEIEE